MRGTERPGKVRWTRPFPLPLNPLPSEAALQTFIDITDDCDNPEEIGQLLSLTDNMPLAVDLIAHLVDYEGRDSVLRRWKTEKTSILSDGVDRRSSLDASIEMSLSSPRITSLPGAKDLLSLLSILPDGLSESELIHIALPVPNILACRTALLRTSLAYIDGKKRLKSLSPVRDHLQWAYPVSSVLVQPLQQHFQQILDIYQRYAGLYQAQQAIDQMSENLANIQSILTRSLNANNPNLVDTINCVMTLNEVSRVAGKGYLALMDDIPGLLPQLDDHRLEARYISAMFSSTYEHPIVDPELLVEKARVHFSKCKDTVLEGELDIVSSLVALTCCKASFYRVVGYYYFINKNDVSAGVQFLERAITLSRSNGSPHQQSSALITLALIKWNMGDSTAQACAQEAERIAMLAGNLYDEAVAKEVEATCYMVHGDYHSASSLLQSARNIVQRYGMSGGTFDCKIMRNLAMVHMFKSEYTEARSIFTRLIQSSTIDQDPYGHCTSLLNIVLIDVETGATGVDVRPIVLKVKDTFGSLSNGIGTLCCDMIFADLDLRDGSTIAAMAAFLQCLKLSWGKFGEVTSYSLQRLADSSMWTTDWDSTWATVFLVFAHTSHEKLAFYNALCFVGDVFLRSGEDHTAENLFTVALDGFTRMDVHCSRAQCLRRLGDVANQRGAFSRAKVLWTSARPLFERSLQAREVSQIDKRLGAES